MSAVHLPCHKLSRLHPAAPTDRGRKGILRWGRPPRAQAEILQLDVSEPDAGACVRRFVSTNLRDWEASDVALDSLLLCAAELVSNVVRHVASPLCVVRLEVGNGVRVTVEDRDSEPPRRTEAGELAESGRGLQLIEATASRWGTCLLAGGKAVWVEFDRRPAEPTTRAEGVARWSA